jgi:hypothetical protein
MTDFIWDPVERTMNGSLLRIVDPGPLRAPVLSFVLRRTRDLDLVIETTTARDAVSSARVHPPGTLRRNEDTIRWENGFGFGATGKGVQPRRFRSSSDHHRGVHETVETSSLHSVEADFPDAGAAAYTIDWLDNVSDWFHWPQMINRQRTITEARAIGLGSDGITVTDVETEEGGSAACRARFWPGPTPLRSWKRSPSGGHPSRGLRQAANQHQRLQIPLHLADSRSQRVDELAAQQRRCFCGGFAGLPFVPS